MDLRRILAATDHTQLSPTATAADIARLCAEAARHRTASVCVAPARVREAKKELERLGVLLPVCTVIGFPNGYSSTEVKACEAAAAIEDGADELDMVVNLGDVKDADAMVFDAFSNPDAKMIEERLIPFIERIRAKLPSTPLIFVQTIYRESGNFDLRSRKIEEDKRDMARRQMAEAIRQRLFRRQGGPHGNGPRDLGRRHAPFGSGLLALGAEPPARVAEGIQEVRHPLIRRVLPETRGGGSLRASSSCFARVGIAFAATP